MVKSKSIIVGLLMLLVFVTPLVVSSDTHELFEFPKMFFVYGMGLLIIGSFLSDLVLHPRKLKRPNSYLIVFLLVFILSVIFSTHLYTSLWGYYTRFNGGLVSVVIFFGIYFVALNSLEEKDYVLLLKTGMIGTLPVILYGIFQHFRVFEDFWKIDSAVRVFSTFGQPNWLAAYLAIFLPAVYVFALKSRNYFWIFLFLLDFSCFWFTYSLSGLLGFLGGMVLLFILKREFLSRLYLKKNLLLLIFSLIITILNPGIFGQKVNDMFLDTRSLISSAFTVNAEEASHNVSDPGFIRLGLWEGTIRMVFSDFRTAVIGTGPETFPYNFPSFRPYSLNYSSEWDYIFNKPHNYYLEIASQMGLLGLISYGGLIFWTFKKRQYILTPAIFAFYITNFFGWPTVSTSLIFWMFLAYLETKGEKDL